MLISTLISSNCLANSYPEGCLATPVLEHSELGGGGAELVRASLLFFVRRAQSNFSVNVSMPAAKTHVEHQSSPAFCFSIMFGKSWARSLETKWGSRGHEMYVP